MAKRNIFLLNGALFLLTSFLFSRTNNDYKSFVWFVLVSNFALGLIAILVLFVSSFRAWNKDSLKYTIQSAISVIPLFLFHLFGAAFLSFFASWENISVKSDISWIETSKLCLTYLPFYFPYLLTKLALFNTPKSKLYGGFIHVRDVVILVAASVIVPLVFLKLSESTPIDRNSASFYGIAFLIFIPWSIFFSRDVLEHKNDKVYLFKATTQFPVKVLERGPQGWGFLFMAFGLIAISISFGAFTTKLSQHGIASIIFFLPSFLIGSLFFVVGLNMQWAFKEITISQTDVAGHVRLFLPWVKHIHWRQALIDYQIPSKDIKNHKGDSDSPSYYTYEIKMNLKLQKTKKKFSFEPDRNVVLYRAYHEEKLDEELATFRQLFSFMRK